MDLQNHESVRTLTYIFSDTSHLESYYLKWTIPLLDKLLNSENQLAQLERAS